MFNYLVTDVQHTEHLSHTQHEFLHTAKNGPVYHLHTDDNIVYHLRSYWLHWVIKTPSTPKGCSSCLVRLWIVLHLPAEQP